jgi:hypothetical protein
MARLEALEQEEEMQEAAHVPLDVRPTQYEGFRERYRLRKAIHLKRRNIRLQNRLKKHTFNPRNQPWEEVKEHFQELGVDTAKVEDRIGKKRPRPSEAMDLEDEDILEEVAAEEITKRKLRSHKKSMMETRRGGQPKPDFSVNELKRMKLIDKPVDLMPKHLNTGKRGIGKTQRR